MNAQAEVIPPRIPSPWSEILENERSKAVRQEHRRFSNELHDVVATHLNAATLFLASARLLVPCGEVKNLIDAAEKCVRDCWSDARRCAANLRPPMLEKDGLLGALSDFGARLADASGVSVTFGHAGSPVSLPEDVKLALLRTAQEAATNAVRHADPERISVELTFMTDGVGLQVVDDGCGFDTAIVSTGIGLLAMQDRARHVGGDLAVMSHPGRGTHVVLTIPIASLADAKAGHACDGVCQFQAAMP